MMSINAFKVWSLDGAHHVATLHLSLVADVEPGVRGEIKQKIREIMDRHGQFDVTIEWDDSL
jgi:Co/Zn/Cd efflux system component